MASKSPDLGSLRHCLVKVTVLRNPALEGLWAEHRVQVSWLRWLLLPCGLLSWFIWQTILLRSLNTAALSGVMALAEQEGPSESYLICSALVWKMYIWICVYVCVYVYLCACMCVYVYICKCVYVCVAYVCVGMLIWTYKVHMFIHACGDQKFLLGIFLDRFPPYLFKMGLLFNLGPMDLARMAEQWIRYINLSVSAPLSPSTGNIDVLLIFFLVFKKTCVGRLNLGPHLHMSSTLSISPAPILLCSRVMPLIPSNPCLLAHKAPVVGPSPSFVGPLNITQPSLILRITWNVKDKELWGLPRVPLNPPFWERLGELFSSSFHCYYSQDF